MAAIMQISASSCRLRVSIEALVALDRVLDVYSSFPGMCVIALSNRSSRRRNRRTRGGSVSRCFTPSSGTRGLWSVSTRKCLAMRKLANFSQAHVVARASFSI